MTVIPKTELASRRIVVLYTSGGHPAGTSEQVRRAEDLTENGAAVSQALRSMGHKVACQQFKRDIGALIAPLKAFGPDIVFNLAETPVDSYEKEPHAAAMLELLGIPYTGNGPLALAACKNKAITKQLLQAHGLPTPPFTVYQSVPRTKPQLKFPLVVKPLRQDGSQGITDASVVAGQAELRTSVRSVLEDQGQDALVEEFLGGREFNVSILGNGSERSPYRVLPPGEYVYHSPRWRVCTFDAKWDETHPSYAAVEAVYPARTSPRLYKQLERISLQCARVFDLRGYTRIDFRLGKGGLPQVLDVNPNPDVAPGMGMARAAATAKLDYPQFLQEIVRSGLEIGAR